MTLLLPLLIGVIAGGLLGLCVGWFARSREVLVPKVVTKTVEETVERKADDGTYRHDQTSEILVQLQHLTFGVSARIDAHSRTVGNINDELSSAPVGEPGMILAAIQRLFESNTAMQSQLQVAQSQLEKQAKLLEAQQEEARTDPLTRLGNRRAFDDELTRRFNQCAAERIPLSLMMIDVDRFKLCNDTFGHPAGDEVLRMAGRVLAEAIADVDDAFAARYGGEEFALLFFGQSLEAATELGDKIRRKIEQSPVTSEGQSITVTASAGIADWQPGEAKASFLSRADEALYAAKKSGRNCSCIHTQRSIQKYTPATEIPALVAKAARDIDLESSEALSKALNRRIAGWRRGGVTLSLILARIDNLAALDAQGIQARDLAMSQTSDYLKHALRDMDKVALLAGGIFGMLLPTARVPQAGQIAERMRLSIQQGKLNQWLGAAVTVSLGVAEVMAEDDGDSLILRARRALEAARRRGGNAVYINDGVYSRALDLSVGDLLATT